MKISATTVMLPQYDMEETAALLSRLGYDGAEWRVRWIPEGERGKPYSFWGNVKNDYTPQMFAEHPEKLVETSKRHNLAIAGIASGVSANNLKEIELLSKGAASAKAPFIRIDSPRDYNYTINYNTFFSEATEAFKKALEVTKSYGVRILIEMHIGTIFVSSGLAHRFVSRFEPSELGVIYDLANIVQEGYEDSRIAVELLGPYIGHVHLGGRAPKQGNRQTDGTVNWYWEGTSLAEGLLNVKKAISDLKSIGYDKFISVEDFRNMPAEAMLKENLAYLRSAIAQAQRASGKGG
jgi:sugar phosphate isomerase/epimerase